MRLVTSFAVALLAGTALLPTARAAPPPLPADRPAPQRPAPGSPESAEQDAPRDTPAPGDPGLSPTGPAPGHGLLLTAAPEDATRPGRVTLDCAPRPARGTHPHAAAACAALAAADGRPGRLRATPRDCVRRYQPVTVTLTGDHLGRATSWRHTYPNPCVLRAETGDVFRF
ncbi:SSI family serine proteinase inhibitor [Streptomyces sp. SPB074]|uniref:SSI family serine proteinase inhibitor n=1 Tax=Streptomyces sp. (strain SPB074) TaxID=465543 RepID=UPI0001D1DD5C|nr:SSI family serine proteinase inhibitor [Streptomyces sp. SPB074]EFG65667.1 subtilase-type protease inhibitor [Streptomyces sp. SPB074]